MNKRIFFIIMFFVISLFGITLGYSLWQLGYVNSSDSYSEDVESYEIVNYKDYIDLTSNQSYYQNIGSNQNVLKYYDTGFLDITSSNVQSEAVIRCYYSLIPSKLGITNSSFNLNFVLEEKDNLNLLNGTIITSKLIQQTSEIGFDEINSNSTTTISYPNISSNYSVRLYMYVEYIISGMNFTTFKNNVNNVEFELKVEVENDNRPVWKILYSERLLPQKDNLTYISKNLEGKEKDYSGSTVNVYKNNSNELWNFLGVNESTLNSSYLLSVYNEASNTYSNNLPSNAGTYQFRIKYNDSSTDYKTFNFTIKGTKVYAVVLDNNNEYTIDEYAVFELGYNEISSINWDADFESNIKDHLTFRTESGMPALENKADYSITRLSDLSFTYTKNGSSYVADVPDEFSNMENSIEKYKVVAGSTYNVTITLSQGGYTLANRIILKYKTAYSNGNYYTIEDAIANNSSIIISANLGSYITTTFTSSSSCKNIYNSNSYVLNQSLTLPVTQNTLPYNTFDNGTRYYGIENLTTCNLPSNVDNNDTTTSCLYIPTGITLTVKNSIYVCAQLSRRNGGNLNASPSAVNHAVLFNAGIINILSGGSLYSYGYTKGTYNERIVNGEKVVTHSSINAYSGSQIYEVMAFHDWMGGSSASRYASSGAFIFSTWTLCNISAYIKIYNGARMNAISDVDANSDNHYVDAGIVGTNSDSNCLFKPASNATQYDFFAIYGTYHGEANSSHDPNLKITKSNQLKMQKAVIELNGKYVDSNFSVTIYVTMSASSFNSLTISNLDIVVASDSVVTFNTFNIVFLLGTKLEVKDNGTIILKNSKFLAFDILNGSSSTLCTYFTDSSLCKNIKSAEFINNGSISIDSGAVGGVVTTSKENSLIVNNKKVSKIITRGAIVKITSSSQEQTTTNYQLRGNTLSNNTISQTVLPESSFISRVQNETYYWLQNANVYNYNINFYDGSSLIKTLQFQSINQTYTFTGDEYIPDIDYKPYYTFIRWNKSGGASAVGEIISPNTTLSVYANWEPTTYQIDYNVLFGASSLSLNDENLSNTNQLVTTFTYSDLPLSIPSLSYTYNNQSYTFEGWYIYIELLDYSYSKLIGNSLSVSGFEQLVAKANEFGIDLSEYSIPLVGRFYNYPTLNISYNAVGSGYSYTNPSLQSGVGNFSFTVSEIPGYVSTDSTRSKYFECWELVIGDDHFEFTPGDEVNVSISSGQYFINGIGIGLSDNPSIQFQAIWNNKYELTLDYQKGSTYNPPTPLYYSEGQTVTYPTPPVITASELEGWYLESSCTTPFDGIMPSENLTVYAKWIVTYEFNLNYNDTSTNFDGYASVGIVENHKKEGASIDLPTPTRPGYTFGGWYTNLGLTTTASNPYTMTANNTTLYAKWTIISFTVTVKSSSTSYGTVSTGSITGVTYGTTVSVNSNKITIGGTTVTATATDSGQFDGWKIGSDSLSNGYVLKSATTITASFSAADTCFAKGSLITMPDGSQERIENLKNGDEILVFDHMTGCLTSSPIVVYFHSGLANYEILNVIFDNGHNVEIISSHCFLEKESLKYISISINNIDEYIGHLFYYIDNDGKIQETALIDYESYVLETESYSIYTYQTFNHFVNGMLAYADDYDGLVNYFDLTPELNYDIESMEHDIEVYGVYDYSYWSDYISEELFNAFNAQYLTVAIGKGLITEEDLYYYLYTFSLIQDKIE